MRFIINKLQSFESLIFLLKLTRVSMNVSCDKMRGKKKGQSKVRTGDWQNVLDRDTQTNTHTKVS